MKGFFTIAALLLSGSAFAGGGFSQGDTVEVLRYRGSVYAVCMGVGGMNRHVNCSANGYSNNAEDQFVFDQKVVADKVEFVAHHEDGSTRKKNADFDSGTGRSEYVNLAVSGFLRKPLLDYGNNQISYTLKNGKDRVAAGVFEMKKRMGPTINCYPRTIYFHMPSDCQNDGIVCNEYFRQAYCD